MMHQPDLVDMLASAFAVHLPVLIVCLVCIVIVLAKSKRQESSAPLWALLGFGLAAALCVIIPCVQTALQVWAMKGGGTMAIRTAVFTGTSIFWSVLRAATYALLLAAVLAGRSRSPAGAPAPGGSK
jgi:predicted signal transduction protein with EAL and GGDEF domain